MLSENENTVDMHCEWSHIDEYRQISFEYLNQIRFDSESEVLFLIRCRIIPF